MDINLIKENTSLDVDEAVEALGSESLYIENLEFFYNTIEDKALEIEEFESSENIDDYRIRVHALKNSARIVGAMDLSNFAKEMEFAAKDKDIVLIHLRTGELLESYRSFKHILQPYIIETSPFDNDRVEVRFDEIKEKLSILNSYIEDFDMDNAERIVEDLRKVKYNDKFDDFFLALNKFVRDVEYQEAQTLINNYIRDCGSY